MAIVLVCFAAEVKNFFFHHLLFFSHVATGFLMFACTLADWEVSCCVAWHGCHILLSTTSLSIVFQTTLPIETSMSGLFKLMLKWLPFIEGPSFYPTTFLCLVLSRATRQHDVELPPSEALCSISANQMVVIQFGIRKWRQTIPHLPKTGKTVGAELGIEPRISHGATCHNKKGKSAATSFLEMIC